MKKRILSLTLALLLLFGALCPSALAEDAQTLHISTAEQLIAFSTSCILDEYSVGLKVVLDNDINLEGEPFYPIPSFSGSFDGGRHTISGFTLATDGSHQGLFRYIQAEGSVSRLNVKGKVEPDNSRSQVGGIVGTNYGTVSACTFTGTVSGLNYVGGIAGENYGTIDGCRVTGEISGKRYTGGIVGSSCGSVISCTNGASVNIGITSGGLELNDMSLSSVAGLNLTNAEDSNIVSDTGGIVGYSSGLISSCKNYGSIGYPHYGYNVGGIAGRQSGYISACENRGAVYGRKDTAGIVGQMEPYLLLKDTSSLAHEIQVLQGMIDAAGANSAALSDDMYNAISGLGSGIQDWYGDSPSIDIPPIGGGTDSGEQNTQDVSQQVQDFIDSFTPSTASTAPDGSHMQHRLIASPMRYSAENTGSGSSSDIIGSLGEGDSRMTMEAENFANVVAWSTEVIAGDLGGIGSQLARVLLMAANMFSGDLKPVMFEDVSAEEPESSVQGRVDGCVNRGRIEADTNVGGIAGDMGVEYEFDLENELLSKLDGANIISQTFYEKCISSGNINYGAVSGKKDNVGGITGQSQVGHVTRCENYASVSSSEGYYVGGIVGLSLTSVSDSCSMCELDGSEYVGGIVGKGVSVTDCVSIVGLNGVTACAGAIAGFADVHDENNTLSGNLYVGERMGGVDGISYAGIAECVSYEYLRQCRELPEGFGRLSLSFVADGQEVAVLYFSYGGTIDLSELPPVPEKEGFNGSWGKEDYTDLRFSEIVEAVYVPRQAALASDNTRGDSPLSIVLIEGDFPSGTRLHLAPSLDDGPQLDSGELREKWALSIDGADSDSDYGVRYLEPEHEHKGSSIDIYIYKNGQWQLAETEKNGSYLVFRAEGDSVVFCSVERKNEQRLDYLLAAGSALLCLVLAVSLLTRRRKKRAAKK